MQEGTSIVGSKLAMVTKDKSFIPCFRCKYNNETFCTGGNYSVAPTFMCTLSSSAVVHSLNGHCNTSLTSTAISGANLTSTISCS